MWWNAYWILALAYFLLVFVTQLWNPVRPPVVRPWPLLKAAIDDGEERIACTQHSDCSDSHACLDGECVPRLARGDSVACDSATGVLKPHVVGGKTFAACVCLYPHLVTQKQFGGNCDVQVACGPHGTFDLDRGECDCDFGYLPEKNDCVRVPLIKAMNLWPCRPDEIHKDDVDYGDGFEMSYLQRHSDKQCHKRPCTYDVLTGRPLKGARYEEGIGCVCEPTLGQFGVRIPDLKDYVRGPGFDACASIFDREDREVDVDAVAYFYLMDRPPATWLAFSNLDERQLNPIFVNGGEVSVAQEFPFDYMQYHLQTKKPFSMASIGMARSWAKYGHQYPVYRQLDWMYDCDELTNQQGHFNFTTGMEGEAYALLKLSPVCFNKGDALGTLLKGKYVLSHHHVTYTLHPHVQRSNGVQMSWRRNDKTWRVRLAEPYDLQNYVTLNE